MPPPTCTLTQINKLKCNKKIKKLYSHKTKSFSIFQSPKLIWSLDDFQIRLWHISKVELKLWILLFGERLKKIRLYTESNLAIIFRIRFFLSLSLSLRYCFWVQTGFSGFIPKRDFNCADDTIMHPLSPKWEKEQESPVLRAITHYIPDGTLTAMSAWSCTINSWSAAATWSRRLKANIHKERKLLKKSKNKINTTVKRTPVNYLQIDPFWICRRENDLFLLSILGSEAGAAVRRQIKPRSHTNLLHIIF